MTLDYHTLLSAAILVSILTASASCVVWAQDRRQVSMLWMSAAALVEAMGALARYQLPMPSSIAVANICYFVATAAVWAACRRIRRSDVPLWPFLAPTLFWLLAAQSPRFASDFNLRVVVSSLILLALHAAAIVEVRACRKDNLIARHFVLALLFIQSFGVLARMGWAVFLDAPNRIDAEVIQYFGILAVGTLSFTLMISFAMMLLVRDKVEREHRLNAETDFLTGLGNRRHFETLLAQEFARARRLRSPIAVLMIDVDEFKRFNDTHGHPAGDACLRRVARTIREAVQRPADAAFRYGGEEFAVLLPHTDRVGAECVAERLRHAVRTLPLQPGTDPARAVTISLGVVSAVPSGSYAAADLVCDADRALYRAKSEGRDRACTSFPEPRAVAA